MKNIRFIIRSLIFTMIPCGIAYTYPKAYPWIQESVASVGVLTSSHSESHPTEKHGHQHQIIVTHPVLKNVTTSRPYVAQVRSCSHIEVRALSTGYLQEILVREGQSVKQGDGMFKILPTLYKAKFDSEAAEAQLAQLEYNNTQRLVRDNVVSKQELALVNAKLSRAVAKAELAKAELSFTEVRAPFDGIMDRIRIQKGSLVEEGDILTTLSDNRTMWVYFNVPESRYLEYKSESSKEELRIELILANGKPFGYSGSIGAVEADFNNETGNIAFRADFPNPEGLLRHGQTGTVVIRRVHQNALVIPQRATFEILAKKYVFVVDDHGIVHQREIKIQNELEDIFVIESGLEASEHIILEGVQQVRDGDHIESLYEDPVEVLSHLKFRAE